MNWMCDRLGNEQNPHRRKGYSSTGNIKGILERMRVVIWYPAGRQSGGFARSLPLHTRLSVARPVFLLHYVKNLAHPGQTGERGLTTDALHARLPCPVSVPIYKNSASRGDRPALGQTVHFRPMAHRVPMRQFLPDHHQVFDAMTFTPPPQALQVVMSTLNTRPRRWAQVMEVSSTLI